MRERSTNDRAAASSERNQLPGSCRFTCSAAMPLAVLPARATLTLECCSTAACTQPARRVRLSAWAVGALHRNDVDVVVLNDAPPQLARHIVMTGRRVSCRDAEADHAFVSDVQLWAADLEPFLRRARLIKFDALAR
jgi:hypothetical protein